MSRSRRTATSRTPRAPWSSAPGGHRARLAVCAASALDAAVAVARLGARVNEIGRAVSREVRRHGFAVVRGLAGHGVGRQIHEPPTVANHYDPWQTDVLTEGLVLTIEPMISAGSARPVQDADGWTLRTSDGSSRPSRAHARHHARRTRCVDGRSRIARETGEPVAVPLECISERDEVEFHLFISLGENLHVRHCYDAS